MSADLTVANGRITAEASRIDTINNTISTAGWITAGDGNLLYAQKSLENGDNIISYINQNATSTTINSARINLVGAVTFSMFSSSLQSTINGKANTSDLGALASLDSVPWNSLASDITSVINAKANSSSLGSLAFLSSVSKSDLATALKNLIDGKANSSDLGDLAEKDKISMSDLVQALQSTINSKLEQTDLDNDII